LSRSSAVHHARALPPHFAPGMAAGMAARMAAGIASPHVIIGRAGRTGKYRFWAFQVKDVQRLRTSLGVGPEATSGETRSRWQRQDGS
jgi:hypothetical protein